jgi:hypothetical protein
MDLRFDHAYRTAQLAGDVGHVVCRERHLATRDRDTETREDSLGLIFVNFHWKGSV